MAVPRSLHKLTKSLDSKTQVRHGVSKKVEFTNDGPIKGRIREKGTVIWQKLAIQRQRGHCRYGGSKISLSEEVMSELLLREKGAFRKIDNFHS